MELRATRRRLLAAPLFSLTIVALVTAAVAAVVTLTTLISASYLAPSTAVAPDRFVRIYTMDESRASAPNARFGRSSYLDFLDAAAAVAPHADLAAFWPVALPARVEDATTSFTAHVTSGSYFAVAGATPLLGAIDPLEADGVAISHALWVGRLGRTERILGSTIELDGATLPVVAVMPPGFRGTDVQSPADLWIPVALHTRIRKDGERPDTYRDERRVSIIGRLRPGSTVASLDVPLVALSADLQARFPENARRALFAIAAPRLLGEAEHARLGTGPLFRRATLLVAAILLLGFANVANLVAAQGLLRRREVAIRKALGGSDRRLLLESFVPLAILVIAGAAAGLAAARLTLATRLAATPLAAHGLTDLGPSSIAALVVTGFVATLALGAIPAGWARRQSPTMAMAGAEHDLPRAHARALWGLVSIQVAIVCAAGGLVFDGLRRARDLTSVEVGFDVDRVLDVRVQLRAGGRIGAEVYAMERALIEDIAALPGVEAVATAELAPLRGQVLRQAIAIVGREPASGVPLNVEFDVVGPNYFRVMGIAPRAGGFTPAAFTAPFFTEVVVNESFATAFLRPGRGLEETVLLRERWPVRVVGVVDDAVTDHLDDPAAPRMYLPLRAAAARGSFQLLVRTAPGASSLAATLDRALAADRRIERTVPVEPLHERRNRMIAPVRAAARIIAIAAVALVMLVAVGLHGVLSLSLASSRREAAIRLALGASPRGLALRYLRPAAAAFAAGGGLAVVAAWAARDFATPGEFTPAGVLLALPAIALLLALAALPVLRRVLRAAPSEIVRL